MEENKNIETTSEAVDKASFADVNYGEEAVEEKEIKKSKETKKGIYGIIIAALALLVILAALAFKFAGGQDIGLGNRYSMVIGVPCGDDFYHTDYYGEKIYKSGFGEENQGNSEAIAEASPWNFTIHNGDMYYFDRVKNGLYKLNKNGESKLIFEEEGYYHQFAGKYIYYMVPSTNYGGFIKRVPIEGGEAETVLNVNTSCFAISEKNIIYYDPAINSLLITTVENGIKSAKAAEGAATTSAELKAVVIAERYAHSINVSGKDVYFIDASKENVLCHADLKTGNVEEINFGTRGKFLNVYNNYLFYVGEDNNLYRMNSDGRDIRNLTGNAFKEFAGFGVFDNCVVAYALLPQLNPDTMQTEYIPVIAVMDFEGKPSLVIPAMEGTLNAAGANTAIPEEMIEEIPEEEQTESVG